MKNLMIILGFALVFLAAPLATRAEDDITPYVTSFDLAAILEKEKRFVLVEFGATWCPYCKRLKPFLEELVQDKSAEVVVYKVDVDQEEALSNLFEIRTLPTLFMFKDGKLLERFDGSPKKDRLYEWVDGILAQ